MTDIQKAQEHYRKFMKHLGIDVENEHTEETPRRVAESRYSELYRGLHENPRDHLSKTFSDIGQYQGDAGWVIVDSIQVHSTCAHHALPIRGEAHVGYIPKDEAVGLSKLARVVDSYARRPQVQERMTNQIANAVHEELDPLSTIVVVEAEHDCMFLRGIQEPNSMTRTSAIRGEVRDEEKQELKDEFFELVGGLNV